MNTRKKWVYILYDIYYLRIALVTSDRQTVLNELNKAGFKKVRRTDEYRQHPWKPHTEAQPIYKILKQKIIYKEESRKSPKFLGDQTDT